jgi:hypothetical protein
MLTPEANFLQRHSQRGSRCRPPTAHKKADALASFRLLPGPWSRSCRHAEANDKISLRQRASQEAIWATICCEDGVTFCR